MSTAAPRLDAALVESFTITAHSGIPGRERLRLANLQWRDELAAHVRRAQVENGPSAEIH